MTLGRGAASLACQGACDRGLDTLQASHIVTGIDAILVTELSRLGRSTIDLVQTLQSLQACDVSVLAISGLQFDLSTPHGKRSPR